MKAILLSIFACFFCFTVHLEARTWTALDGKTIEAELVKADDGKVTLKRSDGKTFTLAANKLSEADNKFIAEESVKSTVEKKSDAPKCPTGWHPLSKSWSTWPRINSDDSPST